MGSFIQVHVWSCASCKSQWRFSVGLDKHEVCYKSWVEIWQLLFSLAMRIHASSQCDNNWTCRFHSSLDILKHEWHSEEFPCFGCDCSIRRIFLHYSFEERSSKWFRRRTIRRFPYHLTDNLSQCSTCCKWCLTIDQYDLDAGLWRLVLWRWKGKTQRNGRDK